MATALQNAIAPKLSVLPQVPSTTMPLAGSVQVGNGSGAPAPGAAISVGTAGGWTTPGAAPAPPPVSIAVPGAVGGTVTPAAAGTSGGTTTGLFGPLAYGGKDPTLAPYLEAPGEHEARLMDALSGVREAEQGMGERYSEEAARAGMTTGSPVMQGVLAQMMRNEGNQEAGIRRSDFLAQEENRRRREELLAQMQADLEKQRVASAGSLQGTEYSADKGLEGTKYASDAQKAATLGAAGIGAGASRYATDKNYDIENRGMLLKEQEAPIDLLRLMEQPFSVSNPEVQFGQQQQGPSDIQRLLQGIASGAQGYATGLPKG